MLGEKAGLVVIAQQGGLLQSIATVLQQP